MVPGVNPKVKNAPYSVTLAHSPGWEEIVEGLDKLFYDQPALSNHDLTFYVTFEFMNGEAKSIGQYVDPPQPYRRSHMNAEVNIFQIIRDASASLFINGPFHEAMFRYQYSQGWSAASRYDEQNNKWDVWRDRRTQLNKLRYDWFATQADPVGFEHIAEFNLEILVVPEYGGHELIPLLVGWSDQDVWMMTSGFTNPPNPREPDYGQGPRCNSELMFRCSRAAMDAAKTPQTSPEFQAITLMAEAFHWQYVEPETPPTIDLSKPLRLNTLAEYTGKAQSLATETPFFLTAATKQPIDLEQGQKMVPAFVTVENALASRLNSTMSAKIHSWTGGLGKAPRTYVRPSDLNLIEQLRIELEERNGITSETLIKRMETYATFELYYGRTLPADIAPFLRTVYLFELGEQHWARQRRIIEEWGDYDPETHHELSEYSPSIAILSAYTGLQKIDLRESCVDNLDWLPKVFWVNKLLLSGRKISDFSALASALNLKSLHLYSTKFTDLSILENLSKLEVLWLSNSDIKDITPLAALTQLKELNLSGMPNLDLTPIASMRNLEKLIASGNTLSDLTVLKACSKIRWLSLAESDIADLSQLPDLPELEELYLHNSINISDLSTLARFPKLSVINATGTSVQDWSPVRFVKKVMGRP